MYTLHSDRDWQEQYTTKNSQEGEDGEVAARGARDNYRYNLKPGRRGAGTRAS
jgi:hypothetical protein